MSSSGHPGAVRIRARAVSESMQRLERGEISLETYLDERAERALDHVRGRVSDQILETVRHTIREQLRSDPVIVELVRRATGGISGHSTNTLV